MSQVEIEAARRRTFAIISHPDAGKTTLTEKLLLYGGAIQLAGSVKARKNQRKATSDWMELEKQRGISITSTVLQFEYEGLVLNLLDTPGHEDFSADTYRTLTAADSAVMLIDNAKGVEAQTRKLYAVCRQRGTPIFTFINKMDYPGKGPLTLLTEVEDVLGIRTTPMNWPIGHGSDFKGIYDRETQVVHLFDKTTHSSAKARVQTIHRDDPALEAALGKELLSELLSEIELLDVAGEPFDKARVLDGQLTPVFFGSALSNFGVEPFLRSFLKMAPTPAARNSMGTLVQPGEPFSGFVFKIQANMDPQHRDRVAFLRVVSGKFEKDMEVTHTRTGKRLKLTRPKKLFAQESETIAEAFPGDIIGLTNPGMFKLGDTLSIEPNIRFDEVPHFIPESFAVLRNRDVSRLKHFEKGVQQLTEEGLIDLFWDARADRREPVLGAVGQLQFEVVQHRMASEYGVETIVELLPHTLIRWAVGTHGLSPATQGDCRVLRDVHGNEVVLSNSVWQLNFIEKSSPTLHFYESSQELLAAAKK